MGQNREDWLRSRLAQFVVDQVTRSFRSRDGILKNLPHPEVDPSKNGYLETISWEREDSQCGIDHTNHRVAISL